MALSLICGWKGKQVAGRAPRGFIAQSGTIVSTQLRSICEYTPTTTSLILLVLLQLPHTRLHTPQKTNKKWLTSQFSLHRPCLLSHCIQASIARASMLLVQQPAWSILDALHLRLKALLNKREPPPCTYKLSLSLPATATAKYRRPAPRRRPVAVAGEAQTYTLPVAVEAHLQTQCHRILSLKTLCTALRPLLPLDNVPPGIDRPDRAVLLLAEQSSFNQEDMIPMEHRLCIAHQRPPPRILLL